MNLNTAIAASLQGLDRAWEQFARHAERIASGQVDAQSLVGLIEIQTQVQLNVATLKTADEMLGTLLDAFA